MGTNGFAGGQWGVFTRGDRKTRGSETKIDYQGMFSRCSDGQPTKHHVLVKDGQKDQRGFRVEIMAKQRMRGVTWTCTRKQEAKNHTITQTKTKTNMCKLM